MVAAALVGLLLGAPALAQDRPAALDRWLGRWAGTGGGWRIALEIQDIVITPSRSQVTIEIACDADGPDAAPFRSYGHIVEARELDLLVRWRDARGPLLRLYGTVPAIRLSTVAGRPACARTADLPLQRQR
jgi:hypothetical protein